MESSGPLRQDGFIALEPLGRSRLPPNVTCLRARHPTCVAAPADLGDTYAMSDLGFIHQFIPGATPNARVLLLLHGTGGDESDLIPLGRELDGNAALLSPRGKVLENGMPRFFRRFAEGMFDEEDVVRRADQLAEFVGAAAIEYSFDRANVIAVGYSNGANIAAAMMLVRPEAIRAAVLFRAMMPLSAPAVPDLADARLLISAGDADPIIPLANVRSLAALLEQGGADVQLVVQRASHGLLAADLAIAKQWLNSPAR